MKLKEGEYLPLLRVSVSKVCELPYRKEQLNTPKKIASFSQTFLNGADRECVLALAVDASMKPVGFEITAIGSLNSCEISCRELFKNLILSCAYGLVLIHNHPSGNPCPSREDDLVTRRIRKAGEILGIELVDHLVLGEDSYYSYEEDKYNAYI